jgi:hypothetical protein
MEIGGGSKNVEKKKKIRRIEKWGKCWTVEHSNISSEVAVAFIVVFKV